MPTQVVIVEAGPTPWEAEQRLVGNSSLPLTAEALDAIRHLLDGIRVPIAAVYRPAGNEACIQAAQLIAKKFSIRARNSPDLDELSLGLWQGLLPGDIRQRFPTVYPKWEESPLLVTPPDGEPLEEAFARIGTALKQILRRNRGYNIALALRPFAMQIATGILRHHPLPEISPHLHDRHPITTVEIPD